VLLTNRDGILPLGPDVKRIAVIGGHADAGTLVGGGSSKVLGDGGRSISCPRSATAPAVRGDARPGLQPLGAAGRDPRRGAEAPGAVPRRAVRERGGARGEQADVAIVFATQYQTEGYDVPDLSLPDGQDALIAAVAAANPNTIVVLQTGGPVTMPWKDQVKAVVEAWYPARAAARRSPTCCSARSIPRAGCR
jgi:beta-glucosidase